MACCTCTCECSEEHVEGERRWGWSLHAFPEGELEEEGANEDQKTEIHWFLSIYTDEQSIEIGIDEETANRLASYAKFEARETGEAVELIAKSVMPGYQGANAHFLVRRCMSERRGAKESDDNK